MVSIRRHEAGYVALLSVLVVGAAATAVALALLVSGSDAQRSNLVEQQSKQARGLAVACAEEALLQVHDNIAFSSTNTLLTLGQGTCTYTVTVTAPTIRMIAARGTVGNVVKNIQTYVTINTSSVSVTTWQETS